MDGLKVLFGEMESKLHNINGPGKRPIIQNTNDKALYREHN